MNGHAFAFRLSLVLNTLLLVITLAPTALAQDLDEVSFTGAVMDEHGAVLPGARVTAHLVQTGAERTATTDGEGRYRLIELQPGSYTVRAESAGFAAEERRALVALAGQAVRLDFRLRAAVVAVEQTVVSEEERPVIDVTQTVAGGTMMRAEVERLPLHSDESQYLRAQ